MSNGQGPPESPGGVSGKSKTFTISKTGTLPTLERLLGEMAALEERSIELQKRKEEVGHLVDINKKLTARNYFLERENNTLKLDKTAKPTRSFEFPEKGVGQSEDSGVELIVLNRRHPAHEDDRTIVKIVTSVIFMFLPALLGVGVWAACLLHDCKVWYEVTAESPIKLPFYIFGGIWCGIYGSIGLGLYFSWYQMGGRRGIPYILLGTVILLTSFAFPPVFMVGHWYLPSFAILGALWVLLVVAIMCYARISITTGISILPALIWTTYSAMFTFFPFYEEYFNDDASR